VLPLIDARAKRVVLSVARNPSCSVDQTPGETIGSAKNDSFGRDVVL
jgi:hypothetical protein